MRIVALVMLFFSTLGFLFSADSLDEKGQYLLVSIKTSEGDIILKLDKKAAPLTVENFVSLAEGEKEFIDPNTNEKVKKPFYDGLVFHRSNEKFMIQGGCPLGNGMGGPGFSFKDEINAKGLGLHEKPLPVDMRKIQITAQRELFNKHGIKSQEDLDKADKEVLQKDFQELMGKEILKENKMVEGQTIMSALEKRGYSYQENLNPRSNVKGTIAMANSGPNTNGSQFFINIVDNTFLDGKHTNFGDVIKGMDIVEKIAKLPNNEGTERPVSPVKILTIRKLSSDEQEEILNNKQNK